jgi:predicted metalloprotease with PDZ domain
MELGFFSFQDYLNALGRAFDAYQSEPGKDAASLIGLSEKRWAGAQRLLYNKGMLVAFLYDLSLRSSSGGKQSLDDVYRLLIRQRAGSVGPANGNSTVVGVLSSLPGMREFVQAFIEGHGSIELGGLVDAYGLVVTRGPVRTHVAVSDKLKGRQKALLKKLGYNEMAR